jgi:murein DD-endopeptidase MepM/ murein hydrolase activator NlpD
MAGTISPTAKFKKTSEDTKRQKGIIISGNVGDQIRSIVSGHAIDQLAVDEKLGHTVWIKGANELIYVYCNLQVKSWLQPGDKVSQGDPVGLIGNSRGSTNSRIYRDRKTAGNSLLKIYKQGKLRLEEIIPRKVGF